MNELDDTTRHRTAEHAWVDRTARLYRSSGAELRETPVHYYLHGLRTGGSIHKDDLFVLRRLLENSHAHSAFIVGAAFGFSSLFFASVLPHALVVSLDNWSEGADATRAADICSALARIPHHDCRRLAFVTGTSPQDTVSALDAWNVRSVDLTFIDGLHTNEQTILDLKGVWPRLHEGSIVLLHDVRLFNLQEAVKWLVSRDAFDTVVMLNTAPGSVIAFNRQHHLTAFRALRQLGIVAHWRPEHARPESTTMRFPALGWSADDDAREHRYNDTPRVVTAWISPTAESVA